MKTTANRVNKPSKRTRTLKAILDRQEKAVRESTLEFNVDGGENLDTSLPNLLEIEEDPPIVSPNQEGSAKIIQLGNENSVPTVNNQANLSKSIYEFNELINKEVVSAAKLLEIDKGKLKD